ncbi:histidinol-phosphatase HisJ [Bacillus sp. CHD6a]|uniref:histidinol-phosphatase HisJ n=1 Tax=Bacillus sp. CHD6a TaxID=1643452 RepID=UPI0006CE14E3|nr:histidinol-phosphatase HisJ [Bacillus sp. CHD6a]KPB05390.1 histidinol phosphatase [Bacillus sp. CHD6a]
MIIDKHVHSPYCPHGSTDTIEKYIKQALQLNYKEISFTEHAPLPKSFIDPAPDKDSAMDWDSIPTYLEELQKMKSFYEDAIKINIGLEVDYIDGYEKETRDILGELGPLLDDSILSVHFLKNEDSYYCLDFSEDEFERIIGVFGGISAVYESYFSTLLKSINSDLGPYKPKRIGHITLVEKFKKRFPHTRAIQEYTDPILDAIAQKRYELDYNGAGFVKPLCKDSYPPMSIAKEAKKRKIPLVYGSDAHTAKGLGQGYEFMDKELL